MQAPMHFPELPDPPRRRAWGANIRNSYSQLRTAYDQAISIRSIRSTEPLRISVARDRLIHLRPILIGMEYDGISSDWSQGCADTLKALDEDLDYLYMQASEEQVHRYLQVALVLMYIIPGSSRIFTTRKL